jgi:two-component system sensor histidine kinase UhpB
VREILMRLRPTKLVEMGLEPAIEELVDFWRARRPEISINASVNRPDGLSYALQELAYRTVQEGLTNAVRHARPGRIDVLIDAAPDQQLRVQVADDGEGGDLSGPDAGLDTGLGLVGMRERAEALGGALTIGRGPLGGWCVTVEAPIAEAPGLDA